MAVAETESGIETLEPGEEVTIFDLQRPIAEAIGGDRTGHFIAGDYHPTERTNALIAGRAWAWLRPMPDSDVVRRAARP